MQITFRESQQCWPSWFLTHSLLSLGVCCISAFADEEVPSSSTIPTSNSGSSEVRFWSFQPLAPITPPPVINRSWTRTWVDQFVLAKLEDEGLSPNTDADWRTLARRTALDLTGLPPAPEAVARFLEAPSHEALDQFVVQLLSSPHYGERWARHWLDVARYAESGGFEHDTDRPNAHRYRDFVIRALNEDMSFDQFVRWQIAGDELTAENPMATIATGFLVAGVFPSQITEVEFEQARYDQLDDMVATTGVAFLGLTIGCARCHDHKYDPISTREYYRLVANFTTTVPTEIELAAKSVPINPVDQENLPLALIATEGLTPVKHQSEGRGYPYFYPKTHFLQRGDPKQKQGVADPGFISVLTSPDKEASDWQLEPPENSRVSLRRTSLVNWITDTKHGAGVLVARVIVNRLWKHHFGRGIVATPNDFGRQGARPTHPLLLDWLAQQLIDNNWSLKAIHRLMMTSRVYRQSSRYTNKGALIDPDNRLHWRFNYRRLEAETIRDSMLAVSRLLDQQMFGPGTLDEEMQRRSIYFTVKRSKLISCLQLLDMPESLVSIGTRSSTTIAPQALMFLNGRHTHSCAEEMARQIVARHGTSAEEVVRNGYWLALSREPSDEELHTHQQVLAADLAAYTKAKHSDAWHMSIANFCQLLMSLNEFIYLE